MKKTSFLIVLLLIFSLMLTLAGCGNSVTVTKSYVNDELHAIVEFSNGDTKDLGYVGTADESKNVTVTKSYVNDGLHAIVEFSNGETKDLGYVGVEVEPPIYKVRFYDINNKLVSEQEVYKNKSAKAPDLSDVGDQVFNGWDKDFSSVQSDLEVHAVYGDKEKFTVTFLDENGNVLKTEQVVSGKSATAPATPTREDTIFEKWDKSFTKVTENITVTAVYRKKNTYTVTFKDYSGTTLGTASVKEGDTAVAPVTPIREGYKFTGWSSSLSNVKSNKTVTAQYSFEGGNNVLDIAYKLNGNGTVTVTISMKGTVKFCGMEGYITVPSGMTYKSHTDGSGMTSNYSDGKIYFMFVSGNGQNVTSSTTLLTVTFAYTGTSADLVMTISDIYDQAYNTVQYKVIGQKLKLE